jgi:hypothetical protein
MSKLTAIVEKNPVVTICIMSAIGLSISLAVLVLYPYSPEAWF